MRIPSDTTKLTELQSDLDAIARCIEDVERALRRYTRRVADTPPRSLQTALAELRAELQATKNAIRKEVS